LLHYCLSLSEQSIYFIDTYVSLFLSVFFKDVPLRPTFPNVCILIKIASLIYYQPPFG
jgi:hypothetical protein